MCYQNCVLCLFIAQVHCGQWSDLGRKGHGSAADQTTINTLIAVMLLSVGSGFIQTTSG